MIKQRVENIGQNATARSIGIPLFSIQRYILGANEPTTATLQKLADYFGVTVAYLRGEEPATIAGICAHCGGKVEVWPDNQGADGAILTVKVKRCPACCKA